VLACCFDGLVRCGTWMGGDSRSRTIKEGSSRGSKGRPKPSLHSLSRLPINLETYFKELAGESDRACALIVGAAMSDGLGDLLKLYFVKLEETDINHLFSTTHAHRWAILLAERMFHLLLA
jgi:hypothetical protein